MMKYPSHIEMSTALVERLLARKKPFYIAKREETSPSAYSIKEFEQLFRIEYLPALRVNDERLLKRIRRIYKRLEKQGVVETERKWLGSYYARLLSKGFINQISIRWVDDAIGYGVYAEKGMTKHEYIGEYAGELIRYPIMNYAPNTYSFSYPVPTHLPLRYSINAQRASNELRFVNHSDEPNCEAIGVLHEGIVRIIVRTTCEIAKGEQLTYDYGEDYWRRRTKLPN